METVCFDISKRIFLDESAVFTIFKAKQFIKYCVILPIIYEKNLCLEILKWSLLQNTLYNTFHAHKRYKIVVKDIF